MEIVLRGNIKCMRGGKESEAGKNDEGGKYMVQVTQGENKMHEGVNFNVKREIGEVLG